MEFLLFNHLSKFLGLTTSFSSPLTSAFSREKSKKKPLEISWSYMAKKAIPSSPFAIYLGQSLLATLHTDAFFTISKRHQAKNKALVYYDRPISKLTEFWLNFWKNQFHCVNFYWRNLREKYDLTLGHLGQIVWKMQGIKKTLWWLRNVKISLQIADCNDYDQNASECTA